MSSQVYHLLKLENKKTKKTKIKRRSIFPDNQIVADSQDHHMFYFVNIFRHLASLKLDKVR